MPSASSNDVTGGLRRNVLSLFAGGLLGKAVAVVRELLLAAAYGTSSVTAAFRIAQTTTLVPLTLLTGDVLSSGFLPLYARTRGESRERADMLYRLIQLSMTGLTVIVALIAFLTADGVVSAVGPGLPPETRALAVHMTQLMVLGLPFYVSGSIASYFTLAHGRPQLVSLRATLQSMGLLLGIAAAVLMDRPEALAAGFLTGNVVIWLVALIYVRNSRLLYSAFKWPGRGLALEVLKPFYRVILGLLTIPFFIVAMETSERIFASFLGDRVVAATEFANFVTDTAVTLLSWPLGLAGLASLRGDGDDEIEARRRVGSLTPIALLLGIPLTVVLAIYAREVIAILYERGSFGAESTDTTARLLVGFAVGLWAQILGYIYMRIYSGLMLVRKLIWIQSSAVASCIAVMSLAVLTADPLWIGLGGSAYGLTLLVASAYGLRVIGTMTWWLFLLMPGALLMLGVSLLVPAGSLVETSVSVLLCLTVWTGYVLAIPAARQRIVSLVKR